MRRALAVMVMAAAVSVPAGVVAQETTFGDGIHVVGEDIEPGTYRAPGGETCYWARLSGFGGTTAEIIANGTPPGAVTVTINPNDAGFESAGCGDWLAPGSSLVRPSPGAGYSPLPDFFLVVGDYAEGMAELYEGRRGAKAMARVVETIAADLDRGLSAITPDPCYLTAYAEMAGKAGALHMWALLLREQPPGGMLIYLDDQMNDWFFPKLTGLDCSES